MRKSSPPPALTASKDTDDEESFELISFLFIPDTGLFIKVNSRGERLKQKLGFPAIALYCDNQL